MGVSVRVCVRVGVRVCGVRTCGCGVCGCRVCGCACVRVCVCACVERAWGGGGSVCVPARPLANLVSKSNTSTCWRCMCYTREGVAGQPLLAPPILHVVEPRAGGVTPREGLTPFPGYSFMKE